MMMHIAKAQLRRWFRSPASWILLAALVFLLAFLFLLFVETFLDHIQPANLTARHPLSLSDAVILPYLWWSGVVLLGLLPFLTMRLISGEYQQDSWPLLAAAPLRGRTLVLGKFLGLEIFLTLIVALVAILPLTLMFGAAIDLPRLGSGVLGLWLLLLSMGAAGLFCSTLSSEPTLAALATYGLMLVLALFYFAGNLPGAISPGLYYLAHFAHYPPWLEGRFDSRHLTYYGLFTVFFLWLSIRRLDYRDLRGH